MSCSGRLTYRAVRIVGIVLGVLLAFGAPSRAQSASPTVTYLLVPYLETPWAPPRGRALGQDLPQSKDIRAFLDRWKPYLGNTESDLLGPQNAEFARLVMGHVQTLSRAETFFKQNGVRVQALFVRPDHWKAAIDLQLRSRRDNRKGAFVALLGDTMEPPFRQAGALLGEPVRLFYDVRFIWVNAQHLRAAGLDPSAVHDLFATRESTLQTLRQLKAAGFRPLGISTARDMDAVWSLMVWIAAAGGDPVDVSHPLWWAGNPWRVSGLHSTAAMRALDFLMQLTEEGLIDCSGQSNASLTQAYLRGDVSCILMEPFPLAQAIQSQNEKSPGSLFGNGRSWKDVLLATLPPDLGAGARTTFVGGSKIAAMKLPPPQDMTAAQLSAAAQEDTWAQKWIRFITDPKDPANRRNDPQSQQYIPANPELNAAWSPEFRNFFNEALKPAGITCSPQDLDKFQTQRHTLAPRDPRWPDAGEQAAFVEASFQFWHQLNLFPAGSLPGSQERRNWEGVVRSAMEAGAGEMDEKLSPGSWQFSLVCIVAVILAALALGLATRLVQRERQWRRWKARVRFAWQAAGDPSHAPAYDVDRPTDEEVVEVLSRLFVSEDNDTSPGSSGVGRKRRQGGAGRGHSGEEVDH